jgi:hypothetical protein
MIITDKDRLDWLEKESAINVNTIREHECSSDQNSVAFRNGMRVQLFTITSQHIYGKSLRDAIDRAMIMEAQYGKKRTNQTHAK